MAHFLPDAMIDIPSLFRSILPRQGSQGRFCITVMRSMYGYAYYILVMHGYVTCITVMRSMYRYAYYILVMHGYVQRITVTL